MFVEGIYRVYLLVGTGSISIINQKKGKKKI